MGEKDALFPPKIPQYLYNYCWQLSYSCQTLKIPNQLSELSSNCHTVVRNVIQQSEQSQLSVNCQATVNQMSSNCHTTVRTAKQQSELLQLSVNCQSKSLTTVIQLSELPNNSQNCHNCQSTVRQLSIKCLATVKSVTTVIQLSESFPSFLRKNFLPFWKGQKHI